MKLRRQQAYAESNEEDIIRRAVAMGYCKYLTNPRNYEHTEENRRRVAVNVG